ncbi:MAG: hypothetical protein KGY53_10280 [Wenzhouxiangellaceae bacterium]|jgi:hypothetical protein|nr:hypothetical protein [Wenzhouxiangellaceae bacterium]MBS3824271.1 hypothetical protein [Wenzhouxiangellaceae bacterium]
MNDFIFEHYVAVAQIMIAGVLPLMLGAVLVTRKTGKLQGAALALVAYLAIVALGMSGNIKHLSLIGMAHALIAFAIAGLSARHLGVRAGWLLAVPCFFILVVVLFNIANQDIGLELMGRWNNSS